MERKYKIEDLVKAMGDCTTQDAPRAFDIDMNVAVWPTVTRAVLMCEGGKGCVIVDKEKDRKAYLYNLNVAEDARKEGMATALMDAAEEWLRKQGCEVATLEWDGYESEYWVIDWYVRKGYDEKEFGRHSALLEKRL